MFRSIWKNSFTSQYEITKQTFRVSTYYKYNWRIHMTPRSSNAVYQKANYAHMKNLIIYTTFTLLSTFSFTQDEKISSYFGIQVRPVIPTDMVGEKQTKITGTDFSSTITQTLGYSFGATVRAGITKLIAFETGISFTQRNFDLSMSLSDTNVTAVDNFSLVGYDIPLNLLMYIQLSQKYYMNASMGFVTVFSPTDIVKVTETGGVHSFENYGSVSRVTFNFNANVGFEYRTEKSGFFYLGGSIRVPLQPAFNWLSAHMIQQHSDYTIAKGTVSGSFLSLDLKYFFPNIKQKGNQPKKGPIE